MDEATGLVASVVTQQLETMLEAGNYDAVKLLLEPVQPVDIAEAIGTLPRTLQALAFRLLSKDEAIEVYEYLDPAVQQSLLERLRSGEVLEIVEEMAPDDRVQLFDELPAAGMGHTLCLPRPHADGRGNRGGRVRGDPAA